MSTPEQLRQPTPPWLLISTADAYEFSWRLHRAGTMAKVFRGKKMRSTDRLFDEFAAVLQFPDYFGENWPAFDECIADLEWMPATTYVLILADAGQVLVDEPTDQLSVLADVFDKVAAEWAEPVDKGESWDRPAVPFHVVLQASQEELDTVRSRWEAAGASLGKLEEST